jgi:ribosomal-protein-alanine N-acetyltransferase
LNGVTGAMAPARLSHPFFVLPGQRVQLRRLDRRDAPALFALYSDREVMRYWNHAPWTSIDQADLAIDDARADYFSGASLHCAIALRDTGALIGSCALYGFSRQNRCASVGYMLAKQHWGHGYVREAMRLLLDHGFQECGLNRVEAEVSLQNTGSCLALARLGFEWEGSMRERWIVDGKKHDTVAYGLLRSDWRGAQGDCRHPQR